MRDPDAPRRRSVGCLTSSGGPLVAAESRRAGIPTRSVGTRSVGYMLSASQLLQVFPEARIRLRHAPGVLDDDAGNFEPYERHAHGHAMVVISLDLRAMERPRRDG